jgi:GT2 family glycosyltransferase
MGWQLSKGDLVAFTDDDCQPHAQWLETYLHQFHRHIHNEQFTEIEAASHGKQDIAIVFSGFTRVPIEEEPTDFALNTHGLQYADFITANCACSRKALLITGGFDERFGAAWREDSDLEFNFIKHNIPIIKVNEALVIHPVREAPWGVSIKEQRKGLYDALLFKKFLSFTVNGCRPISFTIFILLFWLI